MNVLERIVVTLFLIGVLAAAVLYFGAASRPGGLSEVVGQVTEVAEAWVATQIVAFANDHLEPTLEFDRMEYVPPTTARFSGVRLVSDEQAIIEIAEMVVTMREVPRRGRPVVIEGIALREPVVRLIHRADGSTVGYDPFIKPTPGERKDDGGSTKVSDVLAIRRLTISDGTFEHRVADGRVMRLDELDLDLQSDPDAADPGSYRVDATLERAPILEINWKGAFDIDTITLTFDETLITVNIDETQYERLPVNLQNWVAEHEIEGRLVATVSGVLPALTPRDSRLTLDLAMDEARSVWGAYVLPVDHLEVDATLSERLLRVRPLAIRALGGTTRFEGSLGLDEPHHAESTIQVESMRVERLLRPQGGEPPKLVGRLDLLGSATLDLSDPSGTLDGEGRLAIQEASLVRVPLVDGLLGAMDIRKLAGGDRTPRDWAESTLAFRPGRVEFRGVDLVSQSMAAHGDGEVFFTGEIDFRFNGGPLEKIQKSIPILGDLTRVITDRIVTYRATGPVGAPRIRVHPLGLGADPGSRDR